MITSQIPKSPKCLKYLKQGQKENKTRMREMKIERKINLNAFYKRGSINYNSHII
jgi:hypothetical protein